MAWHDSFGEQVNLVNLFRAPAEKICFVGSRQNKFTSGGVENKFTKFTSSPRGDFEVVFGLFL